MHTGTEAAALAGGLAVAAALGAGWIRHRRRRRLGALVRAVSLEHARLLSVKQKQLVVHDGYGNYRLEAWIAHVDYFIEHVILREARAARLPTGHVRPGTPAWAAIRHALLAAVNAQSAVAAEARVEDADIVSGEHYEMLCRNLLQAEGWRVSATPATGDQGADLIAEAGRRRVVIQCKFYGRPVGNKAVQEAAAALAFHAGDRAVVVSNAGFTRSAQQLAAANAVLLLHHDQLPDLDRLIGRAERRPRPSGA